MTDLPAEHPDPNPSKQLPNPAEPPQDSKIIAAIAASFEHYFAGPLPHPDLLKGYDQVCPGGADRIIRMAEEEGAHRRKMEEKSLDAEIEAMRSSFREARWGQVFAFLLATFFLVGGCVVAVNG